MKWREIIQCGKFRILSSGFEWAFTGIYGPKSMTDGRFLWEELARVFSWWSVPWCVGGDFNVVRFPSERLGAEAFASTMRDFYDFISSHGLMDIHIKGGQFTWSNTNSHSRLDRFLFTLTLEEHFSMISQRRPPQVF